jgi:ribonuclease HII
LSSAVEESELEALIGLLEPDERRGAQQLRLQAQRRLEACRAERDRMARLLDLRNELARRGARGIAGVDDLDDSKRVRPARRESLAAEIREVAIGFGIGEVRVEEIDQIGIYQAALEAMRCAVKSLERTMTIDHVLVDARTIPGVAQPQTSIVKGDQKDASIAAASIVAKVYRDRLMTTLGHRYPAYGFERHMGYGTAAHLSALERIGPCPAHRRSFAPVERAERLATRRAVQPSPGR